MVTPPGHSPFPNSMLAKPEMHFSFQNIKNQLQRGLVFQSQKPVLLIIRGSPLEFHLKLPESDSGWLPFLVPSFLHSRTTLFHWKLSFRISVACLDDIIVFVGSE